METIEEWVPEDTWCRPVNTDKEGWRDGGPLASPSELRTYRSNNSGRADRSQHILLDGMFPFVLCCKRTPERG